jgi:hypothetical protein
MVKITSIKTLGLDNTGDGCLVKIETDAGLTDSPQGVERVASSRRLYGG